MKRIAFLDYVRVFACFLVMLVHASENYYGAVGSTDMVGPQAFLQNEADRLWVSIWLLTYVCASVYDCFGLPACAYEEGTKLLGVLPQTFPAHHAAVHLFHGAVQHVAHVVGTDRRRTVYERPFTHLAELSYACRTLLVHVSVDRPLPVHPGHLTVAGEGFGERRTFLHRTVPGFYLHTFPQPLVW